MAQILLILLDRDPTILETMAEVANVDIERIKIYKPRK